MTHDRILDRYSVSVAAESVWHELIATPLAAEADLATASGVALDDTRAGLGELCEARLIRLDDNAPSGYAANDPSLALEVLALRTERRIAAEAEQLAKFRSEIPGLGDLFAEGHARAGVLPGFEIVTSVTEVRRQLYLESERSKDQLRTLVHNSVAAAFMDARETDRRALERGVKLRSIVRLADLQLPGIYESSLWLHEHGEEVRALAAVPTQMQILDARLAVVRVDPLDKSKGAMFIRVRNLVDLLIDLYERLWDEAEPLFPRAITEPQLTARQHRLVALLAAGAKDEAIARALSVGVRTIRRDISDLKMLADATSRTDLITAAIRRGWIASPGASSESTGRLEAVPDKAS